MLRREVMIGAGALTVAGAQARAQGAGPTFEYLFIQLEPQARARFLQDLPRIAKSLIAPSGGEIIGVFTAQLGWDSNEIAVLIKWPREIKSEEAMRIGEGIASLPRVVELTRHPLVPTVRPRAEDKLELGGIYVHRWFEIKPSDREEFVRLSAEGWQDFEKRFDAKIFGLLAETLLKGGNLMLLLLTRYGSHQVWEASRDPTTDAMKSFQRRAQLTLSSRGCSTLLAPLSQG